MKNIKFYILSLFFIFFGFTTTFKLVNTFKQNIIKVVHAEREEDDKEDEKDDESDSEDDSDENESGDDEDEAFTSLNTPVNVSAPVLQGTPKVIAPAPVAAPLNATPTLFASPEPQSENETTEKINIEEVIENKIKNHPQLGETIKKLNLKPVEIGGLEVLQGEAFKNEKLLGLFEIQIPSKIEVNSKTGEIIKVTQNFWNSFLDFISF